MNAILKPQPEPLQLQFFNPTTREYAPAPHQGMVEDIQRGDRPHYLHGKAWRIAKPGRELKPQYRAPRHNGKSRTIEQVQREYCDWALAKGLQSITAFTGWSVVITGWPRSLRRVNPDEYFAVEEDQI